MVPKIAYHLLKLPPVGKLIGLVFEYGSFLLPVKRIVDNDRVIAFLHPWPHFDEHIIIVPKKTVPTFPSLLCDDNIQYLIDILSAARDLISKRPWDRYVLAVNGGPRQEIKQVHFHLYKGRASSENFTDKSAGELLYSGEGVRIFRHPKPSWEIHVVIWLPQLVTLEQPSREQVSTIKEPLSYFEKLDRTFNLAERGYTVFVHGQDLSDKYGPIFHVVSGRQL